MRALFDVPRDLVRGVAYVPRGYRFLKAHPELRVHALVPALLSALLLALVPWLALTRRSELAQAIWPSSAEQGAWLGFAHGAFDLALGALILVAALFVAAVLAGVLAAPINDLLSERVEERVTGVPARPFSLRHTLRELGRVIKLSALRALIYTLVVGSTWLLAWLVPGIGHVAQLALSIPLTLAYLSLDQVDYAAARRGWTVGQRLRLLREHPALLLGFGAGVWLCLCVPLINLLFMPVSVTGGTLLVIELRTEPPNA